jgi:hemerythrin
MPPAHTAASRRLVVSPGSGQVPRFAHTLPRRSDKSAREASLFTWKETFKAGHAGIDQQHRQLFRLAAALDEAMRRYEGKQQLLRTLGELSSYARLHFDYEGQTLGAGADQAQQEALLRKVTELRHALATGQGILTSDVLEFLERWLARHVATGGHAVRARGNACPAH